MMSGFPFGWILRSAFGRIVPVLVFLGLTFPAALPGAVGAVNIGPSPANKADKRKPSPPLASLPALKAAAGPLRILLVDDDWSENNGLRGTRPSGSDTIFSELVAAAVGGDAKAWSVEVVETYKHGPAFERLRDFNVVFWYTGESYGGSADSVSTLSVEDEKTVRRYLEEIGGAFILVSPGFLTTRTYGMTWTESKQPFLNEVMGVNGFYSLAQRFAAGNVQAHDGSSYTVEAKGVVETQFSAVNPDGAAVAFGAKLDPQRTAEGAVPVASAHPFGGGRFVYVGFTFENILATERAKAFRLLLDAAGAPASGAAPAPPPVTPAPVVPTRTGPVVISPKTGGPIKPAVLTEQLLKDVEFQNWGFENGLTGWTKSGTAFNNQPTFGDNVFVPRIRPEMEFANGGIGGDYWRDQGYPNGYKGRFWIGTAEKGLAGPGSTFGGTQGDAPTGTLVSPEFQITQSYCYFLIGGGSDANTLKVELQTKQADGSWKTETSKTSFRNSELLHRESFNLSTLKGKTARIRIVDNATGNWGHINVDDFQFRDTVMGSISLTDPTTNRQYLIDEDFPVWGFADTHAHPAHDNGFGNKLVVGRANAPMSQTYSTALCQANHSNLGAGLLNTIFILGGDPHPFMEGWPDFVGFPRFNNKTHQQQHVEFLKRAWQGGLRLISALAVNNMYLPSLGLGPGHNGMPYDDDSTVLRQIQDIKDIAAAQSSWMEIAYSPKEARRIIAQGKCAVVIGIEVDNFGNFKTPAYNWDDNVHPGNSRLVALTPANADQLITAKVSQYYDLGVRQVTPLHYLSGTFGGAAVFRGQISLVQFAFNNRVAVKQAIEKKIPYSLHADYSASMVAAGRLPVDFMQRVNGGSLLSTINAEGMTEFGRKLTARLMDKGMIIDSEHMGYETKEELFAIAAQRNYPIISSHTDPAGLCMNWLGGPVPFLGTPEEKVNKFGTSNIRNLATEFNLADEHYQKIKSSGGTVGVFMLPYFKKAYQGYLGSVPNDCAGSSKTWAQMYLYSLEKMDGTGVALCTDRGMTDFIAPRFGPNAGYSLAEESYPGLKRDLRRNQRLGQRNGVRYDRPMGSFHISWYHQVDILDTIDENENDAWIAFAALEANVPTARTPVSYHPAHLARITNYVKGFRAAREADLEQPFLFNGDSPWEQAAMYCLRTNKAPSGLAAYSGYNSDQKNRLNSIYAAILPAWQTWNAKYGTNQPLRRYKTGNRDWDFNTDGMAHYGMMPDFLQDLRNIGLSAGNLAPLLRSAEDYIRMWEKTVKGSAQPK